MQINVMENWLEDYHDMSPYDNAELCDRAVVIINDYINYKRKHLEALSDLEESAGSVFMRDAIDTFREYVK